MTYFSEGFKVLSVLDSRCVKVLANDGKIIIDALVVPVQALILVGDPLSLTAHALILSSNLRNLLLHRGQYLLKLAVHGHLRGIGHRCEIGRRCRVGRRCEIDRRCGASPRCGISFPSILACGNLISVSVDYSNVITYICEVGLGLVQMLWQCQSSPMSYWVPRSVAAGVSWNRVITSTRLGNLRNSWQPVCPMRCRHRVALRALR